MPKTSERKRRNKNNRKKNGTKRNKNNMYIIRGGEIPSYNQDDYGRYRGDYGDSNIFGSYKPELMYQNTKNFMDGKFAIFNETLSNPLNHTGAQIGSHTSAVDVTKGVNFMKNPQIPVYNPITKSTTYESIFSSPTIADTSYVYGTSIPGFLSGAGTSKKRRPVKKLTRTKQRNKFVHRRIKT